MIAAGPPWLAAASGLVPIDALGSRLAPWVPDDPSRWWQSGVATLVLVALAEFGDKSQIVCMTLATRHRGWPVFLGAVGALGLLNLLGVAFGATLAAFIPPVVVASLVALVFAGFGIAALRAEPDADDEVVERGGRSVVLNTFALVFLAEFGDKTQLTVAGLGGAASAVPVWVGATVALALTTGLGIWAGRALQQRVSARWVQRSSGAMFVLFAVVAGLRAVQLWRGDGPTIP